MNIPSTRDTDAIVKAINAELTALYDDGQSPDEHFLLRKAAEIATANIENGEGGPFGAIIARRDTDDRLEVVGIGANHVVPNNDPSAHAEMEALRDAAKRLGYTDLEGLELHTSCECCPMCLSAINGTGIGTIEYANTRAQANAIGFSDQEQYELLRRPLEEHMLPAEMLDISAREALAAKLGEHGAMVLDGNGNVVAYGDDESLAKNDPTAIASVQAIRNACAKLGGFHLPEDHSVVTQDIPHPMGTITIDWARVGRTRDAEEPENPAKDSTEKDPAKLICLSNSYETLTVVDARGGERVALDAPTIYDQPALLDDLRAIPTHHATGGISHFAKRTFDKWDALVNSNTATRY